MLYEDSYTVIIEAGSGDAFVCRGSDMRSVWRSSCSAPASLSVVIASCFMSATGIMMTDSPDARKVRRAARLSCFVGVLHPVIYT